MLRTVFFSIFTQISIGLIFTIIFVSKEEIGKLYFRVSTLVAFILIGAALLTRPVMAAVGEGSILRDAQNLAFVLFILICVLLIAYNFLYPRLHRLLLAVSLFLGLIAITLNTLALTQALGLEFWDSVLFILNNIASTILLGSVLGAMITGHWYLVKSKLSLTPLKTSSGIFLFTVLMKIFVVGVGVTIFGRLNNSLDLFRLVSQFSLEGMVVLGRFVIGLLLPLIFGIMVWKTVAIRSTQSATGILYATIILVLIGEVFAKFISNMSGIPL